MPSTTTSRFGEMARIAATALDITRAYVASSRDVSGSLTGLNESLSSGTLR